MKRREFLTLLGGAAAAWPLAARAQQTAKLPTIGLMVPSTPLIESQRVAAFLQRLRQLGWIENRNVAIEYRWAEGRSERFVEIATEFVQLKVDIIVASTTLAAIAAKQATAIIPIVIATANDPVGTGLVASLARPGGNVTGLSNQMADTAPKRLELVQEVVPGLRRLAILGNVGNPGAVLEMGEAQAAARTLALEVVTSQTRRAEGIGPVFEGAKDRADALYIAAGLVAHSNRVRINSLALAARVPTMPGVREYVEAGGLMSYGPNFVGGYRSAADYVDKTLRGAK